MLVHDGWNDTHSYCVCQPGNSNPLKERGSDGESNKRPHSSHWIRVSLKPNSIEKTSAVCYVWMWIYGT